MPGARREAIVVTAGIPHAVSRLRASANWYYKAVKKALEGDMR